MVVQSFKNKIPNILTFFRIILVIPIIVLMFIPQLCNRTIFNFTVDNINISTNVAFIISFVLFVIASITDFFDGFLARKYNSISTLGKILDPIADKILVNSLLIILSAKNFIILPLVVVMIIRDISMDAIRIVASSKKMDVSAGVWGKMKTACQMIAISFVLILNSSHSNWWYFGIQNLLFYFATIFSIVSLLVYVLNFYKTIKKTI